MMAHYGGPGMDGMAMMHPAMAQQFPAQHGGGHAPQYMQYQHSPQGLMEGQSQQGGTNGGWAGENGSGAGGFGGLNDPQQLGGGEYGHRGGEGGGFNGMLGGHNGGGMGNMMGLLERGMSNTSLSDGGDTQAWDRLYASNLPRGINEAEVHRLFAPYGIVSEVTAHKRPDGTPKGAFFVTFATSGEGQAAARNLHNYVYPGATKPMTVRPSTSRRRESRGQGGVPPYPQAAAAAAVDPFGAPFGAKCIPDGVASSFETIAAAEDTPPPVAVPVPPPVSNGA